MRGPCWVWTITRGFLPAVITGDGTTLANEKGRSGVGWNCACGCYCGHGLCMLRGATVELVLPRKHHGLKTDLTQGEQLRVANQATFPWRVWTSQGEQRGYYASSDPVGYRNRATKLKATSECDGEFPGVGFTQGEAPGVHACIPDSEAYGPFARLRRIAGLSKIP